jgi:hypothetical protein
MKKIFSRLTVKIKKDVNQEPRSKLTGYIINQKLIIQDTTDIIKPSAKVME